jgi:hypothetical protein
LKRIICYIIGLMSVVLLINTPAVNASPKGQLKINIVAAPSEEYIKNRVFAHKNTIAAAPLTETTPDQVFYVAVIVTGYEVDNKSTTDLTGDFVLQNPDGTSMFNVKGVFSHKKNVLNLEKEVMLDPSIKLMLEKKDQKGSYIFKATVRDNVSGEAASGEYNFTLVDNKT